VEETNHIAVVTINNPQTLNALDSETLEELDKCLDSIQRSKKIRVAIITGAGEKVFVAGADIAEMVNATPAEGRKMSQLAKNAFCRLEKMPQVTIAAVNGYALGGGCELAMACDIRIAAENAVFGQPECGLGILPGFGGTQRLARLVGSGRAMEMIFTCDRVSADEAYQIGLVNRVVPRKELMDACMSMAERILKQSGYAVMLAKSCIKTGEDTALNIGLDYESDAFALAFSTHDKKEGMTAFLEKRKAVFMGG